MDPIIGSALVGGASKILGSIFSGDGGKKKLEEQRLGLERERLGFDRESFSKKFNLEKMITEFEKQQKLRGNSIEDTELGYKRGNTNALAPYARQLLAAIMGKAGQAPVPGALAPEAMPPRDMAYRHPVAAKLPPEITNGGGNPTSYLARRIIPRY